MPDASLTWTPGPPPLDRPGDFILDLCWETGDPFMAWLVCFGRGEAILHFKDGGHADWEEHEGRRLRRYLSVTRHHLRLPSPPSPPEPTNGTA